MEGEFLSHLTSTCVGLDLVKRGAFVFCGYVQKLLFVEFNIRIILSSCEDFSVVMVSCIRKTRDLSCALVFVFIFMERLCIPHLLQSRSAPHVLVCRSWL